MFVNQVTLISLNISSHNCIEVIAFNKIEPEKLDLERIVTYNLGLRRIVTHNLRFRKDCDL